MPFELDQIRQTVEEFNASRTESDKEILSSYSKLANSFEELKKRNSEEDVEAMLRFRRCSEEWLKIHTSYRESLRAEALDLNVFDVIGFSHEELAHSRALAWLLDSDSSHHQGNFFFRRFLSSVKLPLEWAEADYKVQTEVQGNQSRIDIRVYTERRFVIDIEVKVRAKEGVEQLLRETADAEEFVKTVESPELRCFFLTVRGNIPKQEGNFKPLR